MGRERGVRKTAIIETTQTTTAKKKVPKGTQESSKYDEFNSIMRRTENVAAFFFLDKASRLAKLACRKRSAPCYTIASSRWFASIFCTCKRKPLAE